MRSQPSFRIALVAALLSLFTHYGFSQNFNYVWHHGGYKVTGSISDVLVNPDNTLLALANSNNYDVDPSMYNLPMSGCSLTKYDQQRRLVWSLTLGAPGSGLQRDNNGNIYIFGNTGAAFDADPGTGVTMVTPGGSDGYVVELDSMGHYVWSFVLSCSSSAISGLQFDAANTMYIYGTFHGTADLDPSAGVHNVTSSNSGGQTDGLVLKLNAAKQYVKDLHLSCITTNNMQATEIVLKNNSLYIAGSLYGGVNFNPNGSSVVLNGSGTVAGFAASYDTSLIYKAAGIWVLNNPPHIASAGTGNLLVSGLSAGTYDADPSSGVATTPAAGMSLVKLDTAFNFQWTFTITPFSSSTLVKRITEERNGNILLFGTFTGTVDFDPGAGSFPLSSYSGASTDVFVGLYTPGGAFIDAMKVASGTENANNITLANDQRLFLSLGLAGSADLDPGTGIAQYVSGTSLTAPLLVEYSLCHPVYSGFSPVICKGQGYTFGDSTYNESGSHRWIYNMPGRCDSIVTMNLSVQQPDTRLMSAHDTLKCLNSAAGSTYQWIRCSDHAAIAGQTNSYYFPPDNDAYAAVVTNGGCTDTTQCIQRLQASNPGNPVLDWGSYWQGGATIGRDRPLVTDQYGNFYVAGYYNNTPLHTDLWGGSSVISSSGASNDAFIMKYNNDGIFQWAYHFGATSTGGQNSQVNSIAVDDQGNVYAAGFYTIATDFDPEENSSLIMPNISSATSCCSNTAVFLKLNPAGQLLWAKAIGKDGMNVTPYSIAVAPNGNIAIGGDMTNGYDIDFDPGPGLGYLNGGGFFALYDNNGNYINGLAVQETATYITECTSVAFDDQNNLIVAGTMSATTDFDPGSGTTSLAASGSSMYYFLARYSPTFGFSWAQRSGAHSTLIYPKTTLHTDSDGNIYVMRFSTIYRYTRTGALAFQYPLAATAWSNITLDFDVDLYGSVYVTGRMAGTITLQTGRTLSTGGASTWQKLVAKYNKDGTNAWGFLIADNNSEHNVGIAADNRGNFFLSGAGYISTPVDLDPSAGVYNVTTGSGFNYIAKYGYSCSAIDTLATLSGGGTVMHVTAHAYYEWKTCGSHIIVNQGLTPQFTPDSTGYYYCVIHMGTCVDSTSCHYLAAVMTASATSTSLSVCAGSAITFTAHQTGMGSSPGYQWYVNGNPVTGETGMVFTSSSLVNGDQVYCAVSSSGTPVTTLNTNTFTVNITTVNNGVNASVTTLTAQQAGATYQWLDCNNAYAALAGASGITYTPPVSGNYAVMINYSGCTDTSACYPVNIPAVTIAGAPLSVCSGMPVTFTASASNMGAAQSYQWYVNNVAAAGQTDSVFTSSSLVNGDQVYCSVSSASPAVALNTDTLAVSVTTVNNAISAAGNTITAAQSGATYQWLDCNNGNLPIAGATGQSYTAPADGTYAVAISYNGCSDTSACYTLTVTGIAAQGTRAGITLYPNPTQDNITINLGNSCRDVTVEIDNVIGQAVSTRHYSSVSEIDVTLEGDKGIYYFKVKAGNELKGVFKVVKD